MEEKLTHAANKVNENARQLKVAKEKEIRLEVENETYNYELEDAKDK